MDMSQDMDGNILDLKELEDQINQSVESGLIKEMLKIQLSEFEMLESMFSNPGELYMDDYSILSHFRNYINGTTSLIPSRLDFSINLQINSNKLEVCVNLPSEYPNTEPDVFVRSNNLNRTQQGLLNSEVSDYISNIDRGDICIGTVISWLQENALQYFDNSDEPDVDKPVESNLNVFSRFWIYSHHIYNKIKRRLIIDLAREFNLTGFCLPGRPGIVCIEGLLYDCEQWWSKIKSLNWKRIMLKKKEDIEVDNNNFEKFRKFKDFREISFESKGKRRDYHMDFGEFHKYLSDHDCEYIFPYYFGIKGK